MTWSCSPQYVGQFPHPVYTPEPKPLPDPSGGDPHFKKLLGVRTAANSVSFYATLAANESLQTHAKYDGAVQGIDDAGKLWKKVALEAQIILSTDPGPMTASGIQWLKVNAELFLKEATDRWTELKALRAAVLSQKAADAAGPSSGPILNPTNPVLTPTPGPGPIFMPHLPNPTWDTPPGTPDGAAASGDEMVASAGWVAAIAAVGYLGYRILVRRS